MLCLDVKRNGEKVSTLGVPHEGLVGGRLSLHVEVVGDKARRKLGLHLFGFEGRGRDGLSLKWGDTRLKLGDTVTITAKELAKADRPKRRYPVSRSAAEERRAQRRGAKAAIQYYRRELRRIQAELKSMERFLRRRGEA